MSMKRTLLYAPYLALATDIAINDVAAANPTPTKYLDNDAATADFSAPATSIDDGDVVVDITPSPAADGSRSITITASLTIGAVETLLPTGNEGVSSASGAAGVGSGSGSGVAVRSVALSSAVGIFIYIAM